MEYAEFATAFALAACAHGTSRTLDQHFDLMTRSLREFIYHDWPKTFNTKEKAGYQLGFRYPTIDKALSQRENFDPTKMDLNYPELSKRGISDFHRPRNDTSELMNLVDQKKTSSSAKDPTESGSEGDMAAKMADPEGVNALLKDLQRLKYLQDSELVIDYDKMW